MDEDPSALAARAAEALAERTGADHHDLFVVLGSGWAAMADGLPIAAEVAMADLPGFLHPGVEGHGATLRSVAVVHGVRAAAAAGCRMAVFTNASGSLHPEWGVGAPVLISDQINFTGLSPLTGGPHFAPMVDAYSPRLRRLAREVEPALPEGVYMGFHGPEFETPAEVRAARAWGADVVGMSTVLEVIAARHLGMEVLGLSLATNLAAGLKPGAAVDIDEVFAVAREAAPKVSALLARIIRRIADAP
jgi:purine-nucleoside phosphorylase